MVSGIVVAGHMVPPALPPGGSYVSLGDGMRLQGQPVSAWLFDAPGSLQDLAAWLTARQPALRDLWVASGSVVLAGIADGVHWAVRLSDGGEGRTRGTISAMPVDLDAAAGKRDAARVPGVERAERAEAPAGTERTERVQPSEPGWRPRGAQLHFEFRSQDEGASTVQQIWTHAIPPAALREQISGDLIVGGWRPVDTAAAHAWSRGRMTLSVIVVPLDQGSGITTVMRIGA